MSYYDDPPGEPISIVEDLDPEPPRRNAHVWELALGLVLIVGVLGFAGWQWAHQTHLQDEYGAGTDAVARQDWPSAEAHFSAASGYLDADKQAEQAADNIATRDKEYAAALSAEKLSNWLATLQAIQQVTAIQSGYKDAAKIERDASEQISRDVLSGTIALRTSATPPGLYYYGQEGWEWLPGSDGRSQVRGQNAEGWIVYDVPGEGSGTAPQAQRPAQNGRSGPPTLEGRRLMAMPLFQPGKAKELALDPDQYNSFQAVDGGVWALRTDFGGNDGGNNQPFGGQRRFGFSPPGSPTTILAGQGSIYESFTGTLTATMALPPIPRLIFTDVPYQQNAPSVILDFDPSDSRYLVAGIAGAGSDLSLPLNGGSILTDTLYLGQAGSGLQSIYSQPGRTISSAQFSPDGLYVIVHTYDLLTDAEAVVLLNLQGSTQPRILEEAIGQMTLVFPANPGNDQGAPRAFSGINFALSATFLRDGPYAGKIVISDYSGVQTILKVIDPADPVAPLDSLQVPVRNRITWTAYPGSAMSLLVGQEIASGGTQVLGILWIATLVPNRESLITALSTPADNFLDSAVLTGGHLAFSTYERTQNRSETLSIFTYVIGGLGAAFGSPPTTSTRLAPPNNNGFGFFSAGDYDYGSYAFAYASAGDLHASLYTGSVDATLEQNVTYLYNPTLHATGNGQLR